MGLVVPSVFKFTQSVAAQTWTIQHNLGGSGNQVPVVDVQMVVDGQLVKVVPDVTIVDANTVQVLFSAPRTGTATVML